MFSRVGIKLNVFSTKSGRVSAESGRVSTKCGLASTKVARVQPSLGLRRPRGGGGVNHIRSGRPNPSTKSGASWIKSAASQANLLSLSIPCKGACSTNIEQFRSNPGWFARMSGELDPSRAISALRWFNCGVVQPRLQLHASRKDDENVHRPHLHVCCSAVFLPWKGDAVMGLCRFGLCVMRGRRRGRNAAWQYGPHRCPNSADHPQSARSSRRT